MPRVYFCQRCANHGRAARRRGHRAACPFVACGCADCRLVGRRRELNARLHALNGRPVDVEVADGTKQRRNPAIAGLAVTTAHALLAAAGVDQQPCGPYVMVVSPLDALTTAVLYDAVFLR
ncbi:hypothetical protein M3Y99_01232300 [Aphelenchoides fujianensis]|nr:hypothetical protein M3Y99_01232300 [Aphelenchoides fujianensis]